MVAITEVGEDIEEIILTSVFGVVVVDMQKPYLKDAPKPSVGPLVNALKEVLGWCRDYDIPLAVLEYSGDGGTIKGLRKRIAEVPRAAYITKSGENGFIGTELESILRNWGVNYLLLTGIYASACVSGTAHGAIKAGFNVATSPQLVEDRKNKEDMQWYANWGFYLENYRDFFPLLTKEHLP